VNRSPLVCFVPLLRPLWLLGFGLLVGVVPSNGGGWPLTAIFIGFWLFFNGGSL